MQSNRKFELLFGLAFLEGVNRVRTIFPIVPPSRVGVQRTDYLFHKSINVRGRGTTEFLGMSRTNRTLMARNCEL